MWMITWHASFEVHLKGFEAGFLDSAGGSRMIGSAY